MRYTFARLRISFGALNPADAVPRLTTLNAPVSGARPRRGLESLSPPAAVARSRRLQRPGALNTAVHVEPHITSKGALA
jgi:hypothetical protein